MVPATNYGRLSPAEFRSTVTIDLREGQVAMSQNISDTATREDRSRGIQCFPARVLTPMVFLTRKRASFCFIDAAKPAVLFQRSEQNFQPDAHRYVDATVDTLEHLISQLRISLERVQVRLIPLHEEVELNKDYGPRETVAKFGVG